MQKHSWDARWSSYGGTLYVCATCGREVDEHSLPPTDWEEKEMMDSRDCPGKPVAAADQTGGGLTGGTP